MRTVAVAILALSSVLVMFPLTGANNDCTNNAGAAQVCAMVPVMKPVPPPPAPGVPPQLNPYFDNYYVFVKGTACASPFSPECRGVPSEGGSGFPLPTGGTIPGTGNVFGVIWQETNGCPNGLQRFPIGGCSGGADRMILV